MSEFDQKMAKLTIYRAENGFIVEAVYPEGRKELTKTKTFICIGEKDLFKAISAYYGEIDELLAK